MPRRGRHVVYTSDDRVHVRFNGEVPRMGESIRFIGRTSTTDPALVPDYVVSDVLWFIDPNKQSAAIVRLEPKRHT